MTPIFFRSIAVGTLFLSTVSCRAQRQLPPTTQPQIELAQASPVTAQTRATNKLVFDAGAKTGNSLAPSVETPTQPLPLDAPVRKLIDDFFSALENHQVDVAYDQLVKDTKIAERSEEVATLKSKTQQAVQLFGDFQGHELVETKFVGTRLMSATYLSLGKNFPLRWRFYFYKASIAWRLIDIRVDDRLADMFGETTPPEERTGNWPRQE